MELLRCRGFRAGALIAMLPYKPVGSWPRRCRINLLIHSREAAGGLGGSVGRERQVCCVGRWGHAVGTQGWCHLVAPPATGTPGRPVPDTSGTMAMGGRSHRGPPTMGTAPSQPFLITGKSRKSNPTTAGGDMGLKAVSGALSPVASTRSRCTCWCRERRFGQILAKRKPGLKAAAGRPSRAPVLPLPGLPRAANLISIFFFSPFYFFCSLSSER